MRVLQAMAGAEYGGAEAFFARLAVALNRTALEQRVLIRENPARAAFLKQGGIDPVQLRFGGGLDFMTPLKMKREINSFKPDVVMTWMNRATKMCPKGDFVHVARLGGYYDLKYYRRCDHLIGNTEDIVDYLVREGWPKERAHYLPNFVSAERADPLPRKAYYTPKSAKLILGLGRLHENKAFDVLLKAVARLPDVYLWLAGDGPLRGALEAQAEKLGIKPRVRFLGWRDDTAALFAAADVFVCPSRHEPLGNVVIEGWAQGIPVVAADSLGPGTLIDHGDNGFLTPVDDDGALAAAIQWLIANPNDAALMARRGYETYQDRFTEEKVVSAYLAFFEKITGGKAQD
ncbi:MAG: glycosyltransferase [Rhodospirillales bacterium]|nr:glycosyltransferase [Rhodospirillales bacterium]MCW8951951.1 glycosyltransferase [Rhodospirillales bacterium]MCW8970688.1 glycosyltransferase [Rhodospirillales bacterium]MCW9002117.1 glycosyltransferase [Rhodospirillales bacterium]